MNYLGIDLGGTNIVAAVVNEKYEIVSLKTSYMTHTAIDSLYVFFMNNILTQHKTSIHN